MSDTITIASASRQLWRTWMVSTVIPILALILSLFVKATWLPLFLFASVLTIYPLIRSNNEAESPVCMLLPFVMTRVLFWSAVVMVVCNILYANGFYDKWFLTYNFNHPYIPSLVMFPIGVVVFGWAMFRKFNFGYCVRCRIRSGSIAERGFVGRLFSQEGQYQVRFMFWLSVAMSAVSIIYYFVFYINVDLNTPDKFIFVWVPTIFFGLALIYMALRYFNLWAYYSQSPQAKDVNRGKSSSLRYLIFSEEHIFLGLDHDPDGILGSGDRLDTPATLSFFYRREIPKAEASRCFRELSGIMEFKLRPMYVSTTTSRNVRTFHYIVELPSLSTTADSRLSGEWFTLGQFERLLNSNALMPALASEFHRLYTVTMAWKTYDSNGRRRYEIRNYRPTFRFKGIIDWDVDFNDPVWLYVDNNNENNSFFRLKRFWSKYVSGIKE